MPVDVCVSVETAASAAVSRRSNEERSVLMRVRKLDGYSSHASFEPTCHSPDGLFQRGLIFNDRPVYPRTMPSVARRIVLVSTSPLPLHSTISSIFGRPSGVTLSPDAPGSISRVKDSNDYSAAIRVWILADEPRRLSFIFWSESGKDCTVHAGVLGQVFRACGMVQVFRRGRSQWHTWMLWGPVAPCHLSSHSSMPERYGTRHRLLGS